MRKIILHLFLSLFSFSVFSPLFAAEPPTVIIVTERVPWASCTCYVESDPNYGSDAACSATTVSERKYVCTVEKGMVGFQNMFREITKWFIYITMLFGVLALVGAGILWAWGSESEEYTKKAKGWSVNIIIGLAILFTFRYILWFLAPWIFM